MGNSVAAHCFSCFRLELLFLVKRRCQLDYSFLFTVHHVMTRGQALGYFKYGSTANKKRRELRRECTMTEVKTFAAPGPQLQVKPSHGLVNISNIIPTSARYDTAGPMGKTVKDIANLLDFLIDHDKIEVPRDGYASAMTTTWNDIKVGTLDPEKWRVGDSFVSLSPKQRSRLYVPCHNVPFPLHAHFYGRERSLALFKSTWIEKLSQTFAVLRCIAREESGRLKPHCRTPKIKANAGVDAVLWLNCETSLSITRSFCEISVMLQLKGLAEDENSDQNRFLILKWLRKTRKLDAIKLRIRTDID